MEPDVAPGESFLALQTTLRVATEAIAQAPAVVGVLERYLAQTGLQEPTLTVNRRHLRRSEHAWRVPLIPLIPSRMPRSFGPLYDLLAGLAWELSEKEGLSVHFTVEDPVGDAAELPPVDVTFAPSALETRETQDAT